MRCTMYQSPTSSYSYMYSKAIFINIGKLSINTLSELTHTKEILELFVCSYIRECIENMWYMHLPVTYQGETYLLENTPGIHNFSNVLSEKNRYVVDELGHLLKRSIVEAIDYFNIYYMTEDNTVLNFSSCLINRNQFILAIDMLERS